MNDDRRGGSWAAGAWMMAAAFGLGLLAGCDASPPGAPPPPPATESTAFYLRDDMLSTLEVSFQRGRCCARVSVNSKLPAARAALEAYARALSEVVPASGAAPATDPQLSALVTSTARDAQWQEDTSDGVIGPWVITTHAGDWCNGAGTPFDANGFEAVAGETYRHRTQGFEMILELVNLSSPTSAKRAFEQAEWNKGTKL